MSMFDAPLAVIDKMEKGSRQRTGERQNQRGLMARNLKESDMTSFRKDLGGLAMTDDEYENVTSIFGDAREDLDRNIRDVKAKIPAYEEPEMVLVTGYGDGETPTNYKLPKDSVAEILQGVVDQTSGKFSIHQHNEGHWDIAFGGEAETGHDLMGQLQAKIDAALKSRRKQYDDSVGTVHESIGMAEESFGKQKQAIIDKWKKDSQTAIQNNSELMTRLIGSGILVQKARIS